MGPGSRAGDARPLLGMTYCLRIGGNRSDNGNPAYCGIFHFFAAPMVHCTASTVLTDTDLILACP